MNGYQQLKSHLATLHIQTTEEDLKAQFKTRFLQKGEHFIRQGAVENELAFIIHGFLRYYYITLDGDDITKYFATENDFATSYASMIYRRPTAYNIVAEEDCQLLVMSYEDYAKAIEASRIWERVARLYTENIYNIKELREAELILCDAKTRYQHFLRDYPDIEKRLKQKHVATYLGIHPVSLSRLKKSLNS